MNIKGFDDDKIEKLVGIVLFVISAFFLIRCALLSFSLSIWYDEVYSIEFAKRPTAELLGYVVRDVHPPLYYLILRFFVFIWQGLGGENSVLFTIETVAKLVSVIPFIILLIYGCTIIRKHFGYITAGVFSLAVVSMPHMCDYTIEIRMYSYAMLFVTSVVIHVYLVMKSYAEGDEKVDWINVIALVAYSTAAIYTHYYAAMCIGIIHFGLFCMLVIRLIGSRNGKLSEMALSQTKKYMLVMLAAAVLMVLCYLPWLKVTISQVSAVKDDFWIKPVGINTLGECVKFILKGSFKNHNRATASLIILLASVALLFVRTSVRAVKAKELNALFAMFSGSILPLLVLAGFVASIIIRPIFVNRYIIPACGTFWLSVAIMLGMMFGNGNNFRFNFLFKSIGIIFILILIIVGLVDIRAFAKSEMKRNKRTSEAVVAMGEYEDDVIFITNHVHTNALFAYYLRKIGSESMVYQYPQKLSPESIGFKYLNKQDPILCELIGGISNLDDPNYVEELLGDGREVILLERYNKKEDRENMNILNELSNNYGINSVNEGKMHLDRYNIDVHRLSK